MTDRSERIKQAHLGSRLAAPARDSRLLAMQRAGLAYVMQDDWTVLVEGEFLYYPATGFWRHVDDDDCIGYTVPGLKLRLAVKRNQNAETAPPTVISPPVGDARCAPQETSAQGEAAAVASDASGSRDLLPINAMPEIRS